MSHAGFGRLNAVGEDDDSFIEVGDSTATPAAAAEAAAAEAAWDDFAVGRSNSAVGSSFATNAAPMRNRAASHAPSASVQLPAGVAASLAQLSVKNARAQGGVSSFSHRVRLPPLTQNGQHVFIRMRKGGVAPSLVCLLLQPPAPISSTTASPATATYSALCVAAYTPPPPSVASAPQTGLAGASTSAAIMLPNGAAGALKPSAAALAPAAASRSAGHIGHRASGSGVASLAGAMLTHLATPNSPTEGSAPSWPPPTTPSPPAAVAPLSIPLSSLVSLSHGYKSKKFEALHPPAELEAAACTITYLEGPASPHAGASKDAKKKSLHLIGLHSKSVDAWMAALDNITATPSGTTPSLDSALRAADTLAFDHAHAADVHYHSLIARHFPALALPPPPSQLSVAIGAGSSASAGPVAGGSSGAVVAPRVPSRRGSLFHNEYSSTKGFTVAPSHTRSQTAADVFSHPPPSSSSPSASGGLHSPLPPGSSPPLHLVSPPLTRSIDVLPLLRRGSYFLKFGRSGRPHFRYYTLSADALTLCPFESAAQVGTKVPVKSMDLRAIERVHLGHASPRFRGVSASLAPLSLTIQLRADTHADPAKHVGPSLIACSPFEYHIWTRGLVHLLHAVAEHDRIQAAVGGGAGASHSRSASSSASLVHSDWPPAELLLPIPRSDDGSDAELTDFSSVKNVDRSAIKKLQKEWDPASLPI